MPRFTEYTEVDATIDIDPQEYFDSCDSHEIEEFIDILIESGYLSKGSKINSDEETYYEKEWSSVLDRLNRNRLSLSNKETELIEKIASRFI